MLYGLAKALPINTLEENIFSFDKTDILWQG